LIPTVIAEIGGMPPSFRRSQTG